MDFSRSHDVRTLLTQETSCHTASPTYKIIRRISSEFLLAISDVKRDEKETDEKERDRDTEAI